MSPKVLAALYAEGTAAFVARLGFLFEHSPWVVQRAFARGPFADEDDLLGAAKEVLAAASVTERLALIRAHPELAGKAAIMGALSDASKAEQKGAGLDRLTPEEFQRLHALNAAYGARHGFPFIMCVGLSDKTQILAALEARVPNATAAEIDTAVAEICKIARLRLLALPDPAPGEARP